MARTNVKPKNTETTHEGAPAARMNTEQALRRSVMSCLLWENEFYEDGVEIAKRITDLAIASGKPGLVAQLAVEAREVSHLRHVPLLLLAILCKMGSGSRLVSDTVERVIQRADELTEFVAVYMKFNGQDRANLKYSAQAKKGLARAFTKFDEYQLAKYDREGAIRLRDVLFMVKAKPKDEAQAALWKRLVSDELKVPDTWEVALSGGADKKETFARLIGEKKLGYLALLRNLRNMVEAGVDLEIVREAIKARRGADRVLPFRYVAAARACPQLEPWIDRALNDCISDLPVLPGKTVVLVDVSGSMADKLSKRSDMSRMDAACALAAIINGDVRMFSFSNRLQEVPPRRGMAGVDALMKSQPHQGTELIQAVRKVNDLVAYDRMIVITDEQAHPMLSGGYYGRSGSLPDPKGRGYMINVASAKNGVGYGAWNHIDGFSENVIRWIVATEAERSASR